MELLVAPINEAVKTMEMAGKMELNIVKTRLENEAVKINRSRKGRPASTRR